MDQKPPSFLDKLMQAGQTAYKGFQDFKSGNEQYGRDLEASALGNTVGGLSEDDLAALKLNAFGMKVTPENIEASKIGYEPAFVGSVSQLGRAVPAGMNMRKASEILGTVSKPNTGHGALALVDDVIKGSKANFGKIIKP